MSPNSLKMCARDVAAWPNQPTKWRSFCFLLTYKKKQNMQWVMCHLVSLCPKLDLWACHSITRKRCSASLWLRIVLASKELCESITSILHSISPKCKAKLATNDDNSVGCTCASGANTGSLSSNLPEREEAQLFSVVSAARSLQAWVESLTDPTPVDWAINITSRTDVSVIIVHVLGRKSSGISRHTQRGVRFPWGCAKNHPENFFSFQGQFEFENFSDR